MNFKRSSCSGLSADCRELISSAAEIISVLITSATGFIPVVFRLLH
jgi:hypothetical protein